MRAFVRLLGVCSALSFLLVSTHMPGVRAQGPEPSLDEVVIRESVDRGQRWLIEQQHPEGWWPLEVGGKPDVGTTAVCVLSLLADGNSPTTGPFARNVRAGVQYVLDVVRRRGANGLDGEGYTVLQSELGRRIHTFFAALLLTQVQGTEGASRAGQRRDRSVRRTAKRLVTEIARSQRSDGAWESPGRAAVFSTTTAFLALRSGYSSGLSVERAQLGKLLGFVRGIYDPGSGTFNSGMSAGIALYDNCNALRILYGLGEHQNDMGKAATRRLIDLAQTRWDRSSVGGEEYLCWWYVTSTLVHEGGFVWEEWYPLVSERLLALQNTDGSWTGHGCINGRVFCTAVAMLSLLTPRRYLPMDSL